MQLFLNFIDKIVLFPIQYCIWDHYTELESMPLIRSMHLAKLVAEMVSSFTLSLAALKKADLHDTTQLTARKIMHFKIFFEAVFECADNVIWNIFKRIAGSEQYETLRTGIKFFIDSYVLTGNKKFAGKYKIAKKAFKSVEEDDPFAWNVLALKSVWCAEVGPKSFVARVELIFSFFIFLLFYGNWCWSL